MVNEGVVNVRDDGMFTFNRESPTSSLPDSQSLKVQTLPTTQVTLTSGSQNVIMPPTANLVQELLASQRTMPSWKACEREAMGWKGTVEENTKKYVENIGVDSESAECVKLLKVHRAQVLQVGYACNVVFARHS